MSWENRLDAHTWIETAVGWLEANRLELVWLAKTENHCRATVG